MMQTKSVKCEKNVRNLSKKYYQSVNITVIISYGVITEHLTNRNLVDLYYKRR